MYLISLLFPPLFTPLPDELRIPVPQMIRDAWNVLHEHALKASPTWWTFFISEPGNGRHNGAHGLPVVTTSVTTTRRSELSLYIKHMSTDFGLL
jgi:hypothetical protein